MFLYHFTMDSWHVNQIGQRQVPFLKPHLVTVTDTRPTSRKFVVNIFPKDITLWSGKDSNLGPSDPDALTTRPQRHCITTTVTTDVVSSLPPCEFDWVCVTSVPVPWKKITTSELRMIQVQATSLQVELIVFVKKAEKFVFIIPGMPLFCRNSAD